MIELLKILLSLSLSGTLLILVLFLCKPLYRNKLSRQWQYYIWLVVIARLLFPFSPETSLVGNLFRGSDYAIVRISTNKLENNSLLSDTDFAEYEISSANQAGVTTHESANFEKPLAQRVFEMAAQNIWFICGLIWLIVAVSLLIRKITIYQSFLKYIKAGRMEVSDMGLWEHLGKLIGQAKIKRTIELYTNRLISSPLLVGFFHPCIMLPSAELSNSDLENTILHELTHYKRQDMFYKWLVQVTICFHWFNPFVYLMGKEINRACEFSCDEAIIKKFDKKARRTYGDTLLNALNQGGQYKDSLASVPLNENTITIKERLDAIMNYQKKSKFIISVTLVVTILLGTGAASAGAYKVTASSETTMPNAPEFDAVKVKQKPIGTGEIEKLAEEYYIEHELARFSAIFSFLDKELQKEYCDRMIDDHEVGFFSATASYMDTDLVDFYAEKTYREDNIAFFTNLVPYLTDDQKQIWAAKASKDNKNAFLNVLAKQSFSSLPTPNSSDTTTPNTPWLTKAHSYTYSQKGYYQGSYIFYLGWNVNKKHYNSYPDQAVLTLPDQTALTVYFHKSCKNETTNQAVLSDLKVLIEKLKAQYANTTLPLESPLVVSVEYVGDIDIIKLAEEYYTEHELARFSAIFSSLDKELQKEYCDRMIDDHEVGFFSATASYMDTDLVDFYAEKTYKEDNIVFFTNLVPYLTDDQKQIWAARASRDNKNRFLSILAGE